MKYIDQFGMVREDFAGYKDDCGDSLFRTGIAMSAYLHDDYLRQFLLAGLDNCMFSKINGKYYPVRHITRLEAECSQDQLLTCLHAIWIYKQFYSDNVINIKMEDFEKNLAFFFGNPDHSKLLGWSFINEKYKWLEFTPLAYIGVILNVFQIRNPLLNHVIKRANNKNYWLPAIQISMLYCILNFEKAHHFVIHFVALAASMLPNNKLNKYLWKKLINKLETSERFKYDDPQYLGTNLLIRSLYGEEVPVEQITKARPDYLWQRGVGYGVFGDVYDEEPGLFLEKDVLISLNRWNKEKRTNHFNR